MTRGRDQKDSKLSDREVVDYYAEYERAVSSWIEHFVEAQRSAVVRRPLVDVSKRDQDQKREASHRATA
jgi:hypothetical protein